MTLKKALMQALGVQCPKCGEEEHVTVNKEAFPLTVSCDKCECEWQPKPSRRKHG